MLLVGFALMTAALAGDNVAIEVQLGDAPAQVARVTLDDEPQQLDFDGVFPYTVSYVAAADARGQHVRVRVEAEPAVGRAAARKWLSLVRDTLGDANWQPGEPLVDAVLTLQAGTPVADYFVGREVIRRDGTWGHQGVLVRVAR